MSPFVSSEAFNPFPMVFKLAISLSWCLKNKFSYIVPEGATRERLDNHGIGTGAFIQETFAKGAPFYEVVRNPWS